MYKTGMTIPVAQAPTALFYCCSDDLRTDVMRDLRCDVAGMPEADLLAAIRRLAVKEESILVHRIKLSKMVQPPGTGIRTFLASLRGQAALCQFTAICQQPGCPHTFDFSNEIIKDNLIRGIADSEILSDLLGDPKTDRTLEEIVSFIAQKEQGKATRSAVGDSAGSASIAVKHSSTASHTGKCWACGGQSHGPRNDRNTRAKRCPAWSSTCAKCSVKGHYPSVCTKCTSCRKWGHRDSSSKFCSLSQNSKDSASHRSPQAKQNTEAHQTEDDLLSFEQLCGIHVSHTDKAETSLRPPVAHHIFDDGWIERPSKPHPTVLVDLIPLPEDQKELGYPIPNASKLKRLAVPMLADSGCQSSVIPTQTALAMGYTRNDIMPVKLKMRGAIREDLGIEGGIVVNVCVHDVAGSVRSSKQLVYVSGKMEKAFLCREALEKLGIVPANFPVVPALQPADHIASAESPEACSCQCPRRGQAPPPLPKSLPPGLKGTDQDVPALKEWLLDYYGTTTFNVCEHQPLPMMDCEPLQLHVDPEARPVAVHKPALVPIHWQDQVLKDLERDVRIGVLEKVSPNTPVTWCSRMVVAAKADGSPRRTVDLQPQNRHAVRQTHHVPSPFHLADRIPQHTKKTVTDAWNGYHSVPIREEDRHITTFITPWGRFRYRVAPQGFLASGDAYTQRFDSIIADFPNKVKCVDDTCMWEESVEASFFQTCQWLDLCARNGITLNPKKFQFAQDTVEFAGLTVTTTQVKPSEKFLDSVLNFPTPKDISGARAWFGLVNQGAYAFSVAKEMKPFRHLLKPSTKFTWTDELDTLFERSKQVIVSEMKEGVRLFDPNRTTCLSTDWSVDGVGFCLRQKYCPCPSKTPACCPDGWKLCLVGSRFTTPTESRYAPIEGEALAVAYALHQTRYYVLGCSDLLLATDHKPLLRILNDRSLTEITNRRLLNLKEKTLAYRFTLVHVPGVKNKGPDAVSRYPPIPAKLDTYDDSMPTPKTSVPDLPDPVDLADDESALAAAFVSLHSITNVVTWEMVRDATASDELLSGLMAVLHHGMPPRCQDLPPRLRTFHRYAHSLSCLDGVVLLGHRIVVPTSLRKNILSSLHAAHQGVNAMCQRAADSVFWPGITTDISRVREECAQCHRIAKSNAMQPPMEIIPPEYPFQKVCCDYFQHNNTEYLVLVDRYSNWPMVFKSASGAEGLIRHLREAFVTFGIPEELTSDGGPQFTSGKTQEFLSSWGIRHRLTSVANPHANCRAEVAVKTVKRMLTDNTGPTGSLNVDAFQRAMLTYRNSPDPETKTSPAMVLFGRPIRDSIPIPLGRYCPHNTWQETLQNREVALAKRHSREHEKWSLHTQHLPPLHIGDHVYIQNLVGNHPRRWERTGTVVEVRPFHQYAVRVDGSGRVTLRNRQHLRRFSPYQSSRKASPVTLGCPTAPSSVPSSQAPALGLPPVPSPALPPPTVSTPAAVVVPSAEPPTLPQPPAPSGPLDTVPDTHLPAPDAVQPVAKLPLSLRRLLPHNKPGHKETDSAHFQAGPQ